MFDQDEQVTYEKISLVCRVLVHERTPGVSTAWVSDLLLTINTDLLPGLGAEHLALLPPGLTHSQLHELEGVRLVRTEVAGLSHAPACCHRHLAFKVKKGFG